MVVHMQTICMPVCQSSNILTTLSCCSLVTILDLVHEICLVRKCRSSDLDPVWEDILTSGIINCELFETNVCSVAIHSNQSICSPVV